jgi:hypothetical protein
MGLHWRTRILGPNISALAQAAWDQALWSPAPRTSPEQIELKEGPVGGLKAAFAATESTGTVRDASETPDRFLSSVDFYDDWARIEFGPEVAARAAAIFKSIDCHLPVTSSWVVGAGDVAPDNRPWQEVVGEFAFVDSLEQLRPEVRDPGNVERFEFWLNTFRYMRAQAHVRCLLAEFNLAMKRAQGEQNQNTRASLARQDVLPVYQRLLDATGEACRFLLSTASTKGCIGTIINWQQKIWPVLVEKTGQELSAALGSTLPLNVQPPKEYQGKPRIIVPTLKSILEAGEELSFKVIFLDRQPPRGLSLYYRPMGRGKFRPLALTHVARGVYLATLPAHEPHVVALEYYLRADTHAGQTVLFPATAPTINQTVVIAGRLGRA